MRFLPVLLLTGCSFSGNSEQVGDGGGDAPPITHLDAGLDAPVHLDGGTCWVPAPTNFDSCVLATDPTDLTVGAALTINGDTTSLPHRVAMQTDGSMVTIIHLLSMTVGAKLTVTGTTPVIFAVEAGVTINSDVLVLAGSNPPLDCTGASGTAGMPSTVPTGGGGGGGGGGGAEAGGNGGNGDGVGKGALGAKGMQITGAETLSPLRGGCPGAAGGVYFMNASSAGLGGAGGGALEISARGDITFTGGSVDAAGFGGGIPTLRAGGGGGGGGGGIFLESHALTMTTSTLCADGGSGSEGGNAASSGTVGSRSPCNTAMGAHSVPSGFGGTGGDGGFVITPAGGDALPGAQMGAGGGGGGGAVGWIRIHTQTVPTLTSAHLTPAPLVD